MTPAEVLVAERYLTPAEREELWKLVDVDIAEVLWRPLPGPQSMAFDSDADIIGYGGAAGGGKTDLAIGLAAQKHHKVMIIRRESPQLQGVIARIEELLGNKDGYSGKDNIWRNVGARGVRIEFGSTPHLGDERKYQGRDHDLLVFDEATNMLEAQVRFLLGWVRSTKQGVHSQALLTFNPPTSAEGRWVIKFFAPWLDKKHPLYPTPPGVKRWAISLPAATENGTSTDVWVERTDPCVIINGELVYDFDPMQYKAEDIVTPQSRTFIPSRISDNPYLAGSGYLRQLQSMPEPLRSQMLYGDFNAGVQDDPYQVIPTAWVEAAQARWKDRSPRGEMLSLGCDVARGGKDNTVISTRHKTPDTNWWFDRLKMHPGKDTPDGQAVAGLVIAESRDKAPQHIDVIGVGASPFDILRGAGQPAFGINVSEKASGPDRTGRLTFFNKRSELWWRVRELLDPQYDQGACLPPDQELLAELCAPKWELSGMTIKVESRDDIIDRVGRSPDRASAVILAAIDTPKIDNLRVSKGRSEVLAYDPYNGL